MSLPVSLEELITAKLASLSLVHDAPTVEFVLQLVEEDSFETEDKKSAILGLLEADEDEAVGVKVDELLEEAQDYRDQAEEKEREAEQQRAEAKAKAEEALNAKKVLTPEEEQARKDKLLSSYGYLEEETEEERRERMEADQVPGAVYDDPKQQSKKARKKAEAGVDLLMAPNLNAARVKGAEIHRRAEDAAKAAAKKQRDDGDRKKQKDDATKKAEDKKKKAAKVERRACLFSQIGQAFGRGPPLAVYGDGAATTFETLGSDKCSAHAYKGASARGLANRASRLQVASRILSNLRRATPPNVLLLFGHCDLHVNWLWQLKVKGRDALSPSEWIEIVVREYTSFIELNLVPLIGLGGLQNLYVSGVTFPVVDDQNLERWLRKFAREQGLGPLPPLPKHSHPHDLNTRCMMIKAYNDLLARWCHRLGDRRVHFVDPNPFITSQLDPERISPRFVERGPDGDIALRWNLTLPIWCHLIPCLKNAHLGATDPSREYIV
ncbi:hypothetical protein RQP46_004764 [Phenoliferia psychrophenolica]